MIKQYCVYDLNDNIITSFSTLYELGNFFDSSVKTMRSQLSRIKLGKKPNKIRHKKSNTWCKVVIVEIEDD